MRDVTKDISINTDADTVDPCVLRGPKTPNALPSDNVEEIISKTWEEIKQACFPDKMEKENGRFSLTDFCNEVEKFEGTPEDLIEMIDILLHEISRLGINAVTYWQCDTINKIGDKLMKGLKVGKAFIKTTVEKIQDNQQNKENINKGKDIESISAKINATEFELVCGYLSVVVCAFLSKLGISARYHKLGEEGNGVYGVLVDSNFFTNKDLLKDMPNEHEKLYVIEKFKDKDTGEDKVFVRFEIWKMWNDLEERKTLIKNAPSYMRLQDNSFHLLQFTNEIKALTLTEKPQKEKEKKILNKATEALNNEWKQGTIDEVEYFNRITELQEIFKAKMQKIEAFF